MVWTLCNVKYCEKLKVQTRSFEPSAVIRKATWSLVHRSECKCCSSF